MQCPTLSGMKYEIYNSISDIEEKDWNELAAQKAIYFQIDYLITLENQLKNEMDFRYVLFYENEEIVALAYFQIIDVKAENLESHQKENDAFTKLKKKLPFFGKVFRLIVCGNTFTTGQHSFIIKENYNSNKAYKALDEAIESIKKDDSKKITGILVKDFTEDLFPQSDYLKQLSYNELQAEPNMFFKINWESFDGYLNAMTSKFRTKAKGVYKKSKALVVREMCVEKMHEHELEMQKLYDGVLNQAGLKLSRFDLKSFTKLKETYKDNFSVKIYLLEEKMVGFSSAFLHNNQLDCFLVGMNYELNNEFAIYQRMLYDYIDLAISKKLKTINFGRTASRIKSSIGAEPIETKIYIRHRNKAINYVMSRLFGYIKTPDWKRHYPFKKENI